MSVSASRSHRSIRIGTRGSALALWQANWIADQLRIIGQTVEVTILKTTGDLSDQPLNAMGGIGVFTKEIQRALLANEVDLAVHSLKDLPTEPTPDLQLSVVPPRESAHDALICKPFGSVAKLPAGARIGTGSARRKSQLLHARPDLVVENIRGNVDTRLKKLDAGEFDAIILAEAGLHRLELQHRMAERISLLTMVPAVGQGALGIETRVDDAVTMAAITSLDDPPSHLAVLAERTLLADLCAGCLAPVGAHAHWQDGQLRMTAVVLSENGRQRVEQQLSARVAERDQAMELGSKLAAALEGLGAKDLIEAAKSHLE